MSNSLVTFLIALAVIIVGTGLSFWGWVAVRVIDQGRKLIELEVKLMNHEKREDEQLEWFRTMEEHLREVRENTAACREHYKNCVALTRRKEDVKTETKTEEEQ